MEGSKPRFRGRFRQFPIYLGKCVRMFIFQSDWKFLPMSALMAGVVAAVVGANMFSTMEGAFQGSFALTCVCIWNGFFNSIQSVCRERPIVKREHRSGMYITTYLAAHMFYQMLLCIVETAITLSVCKMAGVQFYTQGFITKWFMLDMGITLFLIMYTADLISLFISCLVHSTTTAMTVMPFMLMFQLLFSGGAFTLTGFSRTLSNFTVSKYGLNCIAALCNHNGLKSVTMWNTFFKLRIVPEVDATIRFIESNGLLDDILTQSAKAMQVADYTRSAENIYHCWGAMIVIGVVFAVLSCICLMFIDKDRR